MGVKELMESVAAMDALPSPDQEERLHRDLEQAQASTAAFVKAVSEFQPADGDGDSGGADADGRDGDGREFGAPSTARTRSNKSALQHQCKTKGLSTEGTKKALAARLAEHKQAECCAVETAVKESAPYSGILSRHRIGSPTGGASHTLRVVAAVLSALPAARSPRPNRRLSLPSCPQGRSTSSLRVRFAYFRMPRR